MALELNGTTGVSLVQDGIITAADLADSAVTTAKLDSDVNSGVAKAWVNFNGTGTPASRRGFNVSSIVDNGTGDYTVNFATAMTDANYAVNVSCGTGTTVGAGTEFVQTGVPKRGYAPSTTSIRVGVSNNATAAYDIAYISVSIFS
jgi:hypothetical protein